MDVWGGIGRGMREFFSGLARGMSSPPEGSKILTFLSRPRVVCSSLLHLLSSWKVNSPQSNFHSTAFSEVGRRQKDLDTLVTVATMRPKERNNPEG
jgi:hypothetical protein